MPFGEENFTVGFSNNCSPSRLVFQVLPFPFWQQAQILATFGAHKINNRVIPKILRPTQMLNLVFEILAFQRILAFMEEMFVFFVLPMLPTSLSTHFS
jgi:hypothetical protein